MAPEPLGIFIAAMDTALSDDVTDRIAAAAARRHLGRLLTTPDLLDKRQRTPDSESYAQHVLYADPQDRYSIASMVWLPGQQTPIHDHLCWCVVGVLEGRERETRYAVSADQQRLAVTGTALYEARDVCALVPPAANIHRVENASDDLTISLHVYGVNISKVGSSIARVYDKAIL